MDAKTGQVLRSYHPDRQAHPASLTKLMTLYLTFRSLESGHLTLDTPLHVSRHAARQQPTKLYLRAGATITVEDAILGITTRSANDAAVVLGEYLGGSKARFAAMMNKEARLLGMTRTRFYNASGLPNARQWTTARDMATLGVAILHTFPQYYYFFGVRCFRFHSSVIYGHDHLLDQCDGVDGLKTGYISASGYNIVTSAMRNHRRLIGVVLGGATADERDRQMIGLMNEGFGVPSAPSVLIANATQAPEPASPGNTSAGLISASTEKAGDDARDWTIETGGHYRSEHAVRRILHSARRTALATLRHGHGVVVRIRARHYRARFSRLNHEEALQACSVLQRKKFTCRVLPHALPQTEDLASAATTGAAQSD